MSEQLADWVMLFAIFAGGFSLGGMIASLMWYRSATERRVYLDLAQAEIRALRQMLGVTHVSMGVVDDEDDKGDAAATTHQGSRQLQ